MSRPNIITGIDLGTDKCVTVIAGLAEDGHSLQVLGVSAVPSKGVRKSQIVDLEQAMHTMTESLDAAERMAGLEAHHAFLSVSGSHVSSLNSKGVVAVASPNQEIIPEDVARVIEAARAVSLPADREIMHVIPHDFTVDAQEGIKDPVGMTGIRLETEAHIVTGMTTAIKNLTKCAQDLGITVDGFVFSGLASAEVVLTETEKELGVVLVDIGAGTTAICAYVEGSLSFSSVVPIGARHITQDIALGCRVSIDNAEKIKLSLSADDLQTPKPHSGESKEEFRKRKMDYDRLNLAEIGVFDQVPELSKRTVIEGIMVPRIKDIFLYVQKELEKHKLMDLVPAGVVITGGGAETVGMAETAKRTMGLPARTGNPLPISGLIEDTKKPAFATSIGLLEYGRKKQKSQPSKGITFKMKDVQLGNVPKKLIDLVRSFLP